MSATGNILIVGGTGFVGSALARSFVDHPSRKFNVNSTYRKDFTPVSGVHYVRADGVRYGLDQKENAKSLIQRVNPEWVIFCAGSNDVHFHEQDKNFQIAQLVHSGFVSNLIPAVDTIKAKFIYISSDYLFSGVEGNFSEHDSGSPAYQLGKAKLSAENFIRNRAMNYLIFRCAPLLGRGPLDHPSWCDQARETLVRGKPLKLTSHEVHNPVHISLLIQAVHQAMESEVKNKIFHVGGLSRTSNYEVALEMAHVLKLNPDLVQATDSESQTSVADYSLNFTDTLKTLNLDSLTLEQSLSRIL
jgi:dTDP-4-dehydrorhamnose reductase